MGPENSGSLTGHLLDQDMDSGSGKSNTTKVILILAVVLGLLTLGTLGLVFFAQDWIHTTFGG